MPVSLVAILVAVPVITIFFVFALLPRMRSHEEKQKRGDGRRSTEKRG